MKNTAWILIFAALVLLCAISSYLIFSGGGGKLVGVYVDGELIETIDLGLVTEAYELTVADGGNVISVSPDGLRVSSASCPDQTCVEHGFLRSGAPIVCLPHRLVIKWLDSDADYDARTG
jgi:hypothetical protein